MHGDFRTLNNLNFKRKAGSMINTYYAAFLAIMNIGIFNMVIAVLADTYDKVTEKRAQWVKKLKIKLLSSLIPVLPSKEKQDFEDVFMIIVKPIDETENGVEDWSGKINKIIDMT